MNLQSKDSGIGSFVEARDSKFGGGMRICAAARQHGGNGNRGHSRILLYRNPNYLSIASGHRAQEIDERGGHQGGGEGHQDHHGKERGGKDVQVEADIEDDELDETPGVD